MVEPRGSGSWEAGSQYTYNSHMSGSLFITWENIGLEATGGMSPEAVEFMPAATASGHTRRTANGDSLNVHCHGQDKRKCTLALMSPPPKSLTLHYSPD